MRFLEDIAGATSNARAARVFRAYARRWGASGLRGRAGLFAPAMPDGEYWEESWLNTAPGP